MRCQSKEEEKEPRETKESIVTKAKAALPQSSGYKKRARVDVFIPTDKLQRPNTSTNCCRGWFAAQSSMHFQDTFSFPLSEAARIQDYPNELKMQMILTHCGPSHWHPREAITSLQLAVLAVPGRFFTFGRRLQTVQLGGAPGCSGHRLPLEAVESQVGSAAPGLVSFLEMRSLFQ